MCVWRLILQVYENLWSKRQQQTSPTIQPAVLLVKVALRLNPCETPTVCLFLVYEQNKQRNRKMGDRPSLPSRAKKD